ncbi:MAG TPA: DNA polymerase IV [Methanospirillum sp.]|nr:DNA polymerase IV [Methanospirillum sp.]
MNPQIIGHIDMDSFYASIEIRDNPELSGKPVVIGSDPQEGHGRGVVSTCSYEARKFGLHSGMPISRAWHLCPHAVFIRPGKKYAQVSARIMVLIREFVPDMEQVSIDEAYLNLTECVSYPAAELCAWEIKKAIREKEGLTCSIGIAPARSYAKIASEIHKPDGLVTLTPDTLISTIHPLPASSIPGVGRKSGAILTQKGIRTIGDIALCDIQKLQDIFGGYAVRLQMIATGYDGSGLKDRGPSQSIGRDTTFASDTDDPYEIEEMLSELASSVRYELIRKKARCRTVGVRIRYTGFITRSRAVSWLHPDDSAQAIERTMRTIFFELWSGKPVRLVGIRLSGLVYPDPVQTKLSQYS